MNIPIPDALTSENSLEYIVSIRLSPDGLSFSGYRPSVDGSFFYRPVKFDNASTYITGLKNCFFSNECLSWSYAKVRIVSLAGYTLVPEPFYDETYGREWLELCYLKPGDRVLTAPVDAIQARLVYGLDEVVWSFCSRSFVKAEFSHYLEALLAMWLRESQSDESRRMYVVVEGKRMDVACVDKGKLLFLNTFSAPELNNQIYFILYVWKRMGWSVERDTLALYADSSVRSGLLERLKEYLRQVHVMAVPAEVYTRGTDLFKAPVDIIAFSL